MRRSMLVLAAVALAMPGLAAAHPDVTVWRAGGDGAYSQEAYGGDAVPPPGRWALQGGDAMWSDDEGLNAFFYPNGYDPQYGSEGRVADAADFADEYGCRPIWNAKYGRYMPACN